MAGDTNLNRYVGNHPTNSTDPSGLAEGWEWNWHHMLDQAIFDQGFMNRHGLNIDIHSRQYGWMLRAKAPHFLTMQPSLIPQQRANLDARIGDQKRRLSRLRRRGPKPGG